MFSLGGRARPGKMTDILCQQFWLNTKRDNSTALDCCILLKRKCEHVHSNTAALYVFYKR